MMADENQNSTTESTVESQVTSAPEAAEDDFSKLLAESEQSLEQKSFEKGMIVEGIIVQIGAEFAYVNIGAKAEASIAVSELLNPEDGKLTHVVGDTIKAKVVGFENGAIRLSRSNKVGNIALEEAFQSGCAVKALVKATNKGGFELEVMGQRAFCPLSQIQKGKVEDPNALVGQSFDFKIIKYAKRGHDIVLSRTALIDEEARMKRDEAMAKIEVGATLDGKVVSIKKGDTVKVIAGRDKDKEGKVLAVNAAAGTVLVEGVNMIKKHTKPNNNNQEGGIVTQEGPINISNVMYVHKGQATRVGFKFVDGKKVRYAKSNDEVID